ncbi:replication initiator protein A [Margalitia sp. FSL K6-0131]|uniref:replication initiator protein A n=1 Tax=Margalitia sp. FSL K6-0131 TaxID=2954604 RepID=UPI0030FB2956
MSQYFDIYEEYGLKHYQIPKVFFTSKLYESLSLQSKIAWAILRDRFSLSKKNGWYEKDTKRIYFIFSNKDLMEILNIKSETTITKIKKELEKAKLLEQRRMGLTVPNRLYLLKPIVTEEDIYKIDKTEAVPDENEYIPTPYTKKENENFNESRTTKNGVQSNINRTTKNGVQSNINRTTKNEVQEPHNVESINTESINLTYKDTYKDTIKLSSFESLDREIDMQKEKLLKNSLKDKMPERIYECLNVFCNTFDEMYNYYGVLLRGKDKACKERQAMIRFEDFEEEYHQCLLSCFRNEKNIDEFKNYLFTSIYLLTDQIIAELQKNKNNSTFNEMTKWLREF